MRAIHDDGDEKRVLASDLRVAESAFAQARGLMFRRSLPEDAALVMSFSTVRRRSLHSGFVFVPFDVIWVADGTVRRTATFRPFRSVAWAKADLILELPVGEAEPVNLGDSITLQNSPEG